MYCPKCGAQIHDDAVMCVHCGCAVENNQQNSQQSNNQPVNNSEISTYSGLAVLLLCLFLGGLGIHRFYVGKTGTGIAQLLTLGGCGIWTLVDFIMILTGDFRDVENKVVKL